MEKNLKVPLKKVLVEFFKVPQMKLMQELPKMLVKKNFQCAPEENLKLIAEGV